MPTQVQIAKNFNQIGLFWDVAPWDTVAYFKLEFSLDRSVWAEVESGFRNYHPSIEKVIEFEFDREDLSLEETDTFFLRLVEFDKDDNQVSVGPVKQVPAVSDVSVIAGALNSPLKSSESFSLDISTVQRITFSEDAKYLEVFNNSIDDLYISIDGLDADATRSMIVAPNSFYSISANIPKDVGVSLLSSGTSNVRVVSHY
jgi:hypothetical protein